MEWKKIERFSSENIEYYISDQGDVKSVTNGKEHILKPQVQTGGYLCVYLPEEGKTRCVLIHRMVGKAFVQNPDPEHKNVVHHKNQDKQCPVKENLQWVTQKENINAGDVRKRIAIKHSIWILGVNSKGKTVIFESIEDCRERLGITNRQRILDILDNNADLLAPEEMGIRVLSGEVWQLHRIDQVFNKDGKTTYKSPDFRKKERISAGMEESRLPFSIPVDRNGKRITARVLPFPNK